MKTNPKYVQLIGDALIPLLGLFLWGWSLYFILLFYFIDIIAAETIVHLKSRKTVAFQMSTGQKTTWFKWGVVSFLLLTLAILITHFAVYFISPGIDFQKEALMFWNYEEMGVKQGVILVPLIVLVSYQQYRMTFLMAGRFRNNNMFVMWKKHIISLILIMAFASIGLAISWFVKMPETVYVLVIIAISSAYKFRYNEL